MSTTEVERLMRADTSLTRSFIAAAATWVGGWIWTLYLAGPDPFGNPRMPWLGMGLGLLQIGAYVWYAIAAGRAASALGDSGWKFVVWIVVAPFLALLPLPVISSLIAASPLAIKFLLGGRLQTAIRVASFADLHAST